LAIFAGFFEGKTSGCEKYACFCFLHLHVFGTLSMGGGVIVLKHKGDYFSAALNRLQGS